MIYECGKFKRHLFNSKKANAIPRAEAFFYAQIMINILQGDCMDLMAGKEDNHYDLAIVDPEYGIGADKQSKKPNKAIQKNGNVLNIKPVEYIQKDWDSKPADKKYFKELKRVSRNQIIWGVNYYEYNLKGGRIVWDKINGDSDQYGCEIAYNSFNNRTDIIRYMWAGMFQGLTISKDISIANEQQGNKKLNEKRIHPTQKPVALYKWLLKNYAKEGDKILDTHGGSMSSAIACHDYKYDLDIIELDKDYYKAGKKRFDNHVKQLQLF